MTSADPTQPAVRPGSTGRRRRGYFLPGGIALAALLLIGGALGAGDLFYSAPRTLSGPDISSELALGIQAQQGSDRVPVVTCPGSEPERAGLRFTCTLAGEAGRPGRAVDVTEIDARGHLRWTVTPR